MTTVSDALRTSIMSDFAYRKQAMKVLAGDETARRRTRRPLDGEGRSSLYCWQSRKARMAMLRLEYKLDGNLARYAAIDEGIRITQFIRNTCLRDWMDRLPEGKSFAAMST